MPANIETIQLSENCDSVPIVVQKLYRINHPNGRQIRAMSGELLITQASNFLYIVLKPGETFIPTKKGLVLLEAITEAQISIEMPIAINHSSVPNSCEKINARQHKNADTVSMDMNEIFWVKRL